MDAEIVSLLNSGATTLLGLMVTDAWSKAKRVVMGIVGDKDDVSLGTDLEESRTRLMNAVKEDDLDAQSELHVEWRSRLRRVVSNNPAKLDDLRTFVEQYANAVNADGLNANSISLTGMAFDSGRVYQQGHGTQYNL